MANSAHSSLTAEQLRQRHAGAQALLDHLRAWCGSRRTQEDREGGTRTLQADIEGKAELFLLDLTMQIHRANTTEKP